MNMLYSRKTTSADRSSSPNLVPLPSPGRKSIDGEPRTTADEWTEESNRQAAASAGGATAPAEAGLFTEFRRKLAMGEALSRAVAKLAEALRFSGRITVSFHQGRITKTVFEELHIQSSKATGTLS
jgi:hypothetical protein